MTTALANQQGELVIPMLMTGTMQQPRFAPDAQRMAEMKLRNLVPNLRNPQQLTTGILGAIAGQKDDGRTGKRTLEDIVGAVTGRGQPPPAGEQPKDAAGTAPTAVPAGAAKAPAGEAPKAEAVKPAPKDAVQQLRDRLRGLLGGGKKEEPKPPPEEQKGQP